jgi:hypothetical protein
MTHFKTLCTTTHSKITQRILPFGISTLGIMTLGITTLSTSTLTKVTLNMTDSIIAKDAQHNNKNVALGKI